MMGATLSGALKLAPFQGTFCVGDGGSPVMV